jgi:nucleotide-binding universal stress UspA family protein
VYKKILIPVDGSDTSDAALVAALELAKESKGQVRALHLVDDLAYISGYEAYGAYSVDLIDIAQKIGTQVLDAAMAATKVEQVQADSVLINTVGVHLGDAVANAAKHWKADLIVVGTHGRRGVGRMFLGSGAEEIIRLSPVPVLVIRLQNDLGNRTESSHG